MRYKSDSCFTLCSNRCDNLWKNGLPTLQKDSQTISLNTVQLKNSQFKIIKFINAFIQDKFLIVDQRHINLENLQLKRQILKNSEGQILNSQHLIISNNLDFIEISGTVLQINQIFNFLKLFTIQQHFEKRYQIIKILGKGSFAKVFKVKLIHNDIQQMQNLGYKVFASKIFNKIKIRQNQEENEMSLWKEIEIMRSMDNQHIIKLHEIFEDEKKVYLILDLLEGGELLSYIQNKVNMYDETLVQQLIYNLLDALSYIHSKNIIHRDIKPENLIMKQKNNIENIVSSIQKNKTIVINLFLSILPPKNL